MTLEDYLRPKRVWSEKGALFQSALSDTRSQLDFQVDWPTDDWILTTESMHPHPSYAMLAVMKPAGDAVIATITAASPA
ncbi:MAG: hypothetical protein U0905_20040 [Pirellulales bacterium]